MRKSIISLLLLLAVLPLMGQSLLDSLPGHRMKASYTYSLSQGGAPMKEVSSGIILVQDNAYRLDALGLEVYCDGQKRWSVDPSAGEVLLEEVDTEDMLTNPLQIIHNWKSMGDRLHFNSRGKDSLDATVKLDDKTSVRVVLKDVVLSEPGPVSDFVPDPGKIKDYILTDLR